MVCGISPQILVGKDRYCGILPTSSDDHFKQFCLYSINPWAVFCGLIQKPVSFSVVCIYVNSHIWRDDLSCLFMLSRRCISPFSFHIQRHIFSAVCQMNTEMHDQCRCVSPCSFPIPHCGRSVDCKMDREKYKPWKLSVWFCVAHSQCTVLPVQKSTSRGTWVSIHLKDNNLGALG